MTTAQKLTLGFFLVIPAVGIILGIAGLIRPAAVVFSLLPLVILGALALVNAAFQQPRRSDVSIKHATATFNGVVRGTPTEVRDQIKSNAAQHKRFTLVHSDDVDLKVRIGMAATTWGEVAHFQLEPAADAETRVSATCKQRLSFVLVDYGQSGLDLSLLLQGLDTVEQPDPART